jgi:hypothetical protein
MQGYNKKGQVLIPKKKGRRNPIGKCNIERKIAFTSVRLRSFALPAKQANIIFDPFAHSIINVTTMVNGNGIITSRITHHHCRLYHKFGVYAHTQMNIYLICHL